MKTIFPGKSLQVRLRTASIINNISRMISSSNTSLKNVAANYAKLLQLKVTAKSIQKNIEENPYYPSLLSLSDTFSRYGFENAGYQVDVADISLLTEPFIAYVRIPDKGEDFVLVTRITDTEVSYLHRKNKPETISKEAFIQQFKKVVWIAEKTVSVEEPGYADKRKVETKMRHKKAWLITSGVTILCLLVGVNLSGVNAGSFVPILTLKLIGTAITIMLLVYELDKNNAFVKDICTAGKSTNCDAVLNSNAATIAGLSWGEIGLFYFSSSLLLLLTNSISDSEKMAAIAIANCVALPYVFFSIFYQWQVVKQWCPLCLSVQALLVAEFCWSFIVFWRHPLLPLLSFKIISLILIVLLIPIVIWFTLKPVFTKAKDYNLYHAGYKRLQYNPEIFNSLLMQQFKAPDGWQELGITIGNPDAENTIIKVCNPYCSPCARAHPKLEALMEQKENVKLKIIFAARNDGYDPGATPVKHFLAIAEEAGPEQIKAALDDWYLTEKKDYDAFASKYPIKGNLQEQAYKIGLMRQWCEKAEINHTPTIFLNGFMLPENYQVEELQNIL